MAREKKPATDIPVKHRTRPPAPSPGPKSPARKRRVGVVMGMSLPQLMVLILVLIAILWTVAYPLRNYFAQRGEIARLTSEVEAKKEQKTKLLTELERYQSDEYVQEQARVRLGLIQPGELAFRIIAPPVEGTHEGPTTPDGTPTDTLGPWWQVMWDSIATPEKAPTLPEGVMVTPSETPVPRPKPNGVVVPGLGSNTDEPNPEAPPPPPDAEVPPPPPEGEVPPPPPAPEGEPPPPPAP